MEEQFLQRGKRSPIKEIAAEILCWCVVSKISEALCSFVVVPNASEGLLVLLGSCMKGRDSYVKNIVLKCLIGFFLFFVIDAGEKESEDSVHIGFMRCN